MVRRTKARQTVGLSLTTAILGSVTAVVINLATEWKYNLWAWLAVGVLTTLTTVVSVWQGRQGASDAPTGDRPDNDVAIGRNLSADDVTFESPVSNRFTVGRTAKIKNLDMRAGSPRDPR